jgi:hypothetical protein
MGFKSERGYFMPDLTPLFWLLPIIGAVAAILIWEGFWLLWDFIKPWIHKVTQ